MSIKELSGRELDFAIAERVMGSLQNHKSSGWGRGRADASGIYTESHCAYCGTLRDDSDLTWWSNSCAESAPRYGESIEAAMRVVERMWESGWQVEMVNGHKLHTHIADNVSSWYVRFINNENDMNNWSAEADTPPLAICRAALTAVAQRDAVAVMEQKS